MIDAPIVWVASTNVDELGAVPGVLQSWAASRGLRLVEPQDGGMRAIEVDANVAQRVEEDLHQARELVTQHDADGAERALARGEALLRAHPELPQAAWLLAEVERGWATRFARLDPPDALRAARHWRAAAALDGGRAAGVGEVSASPDGTVSFSLEAGSVGALGELRWDGELITRGAHTTTPGLHQLVAKVDGRVVFAQWIAIAQNDTRVRVALPMAEPCSRADLGGAQMCATWISATRTRDPSTFIVRMCSGAACGPELTIAPSTWSALPARKNRGIPAWAGWTLAGVGVAAALATAASIIVYFALPPIQQTRWTTSSPQ